MLKATTKRPTVPVAQATSPAPANDSPEPAASCLDTAAVALVDLAQSAVLKCLVKHQGQQRSQGWVSLADLMILCRLSQLEATLQLKALFACQMLESITGNGAVANRYRIDPAVQVKLPSHPVQVAMPAVAATKMSLDDEKPHEALAVLPDAKDSLKKAFHGDTKEAFLIVEQGGRLVDLPAEAVKPAGAPKSVKKAPVRQPKPIPAHTEVILAPRKASKKTPPPIAAKSANKKKPSALCKPTKTASGKAKKLVEK